MTIDELLKFMVKVGKELGLHYQRWDSEWPIIWTFFRESGNEDTIQVGLDTYQCSQPDIDVPKLYIEVKSILTHQMKNWVEPTEEATVLCSQCARNADRNKPCWWCGNRN